MKRIRSDERGSILILTMLALVGAMSIAVAMSSISIVERKMTTKSRKSVTAFQAANGGVEWALKKINDAEPGDNISDVFGGSVPNDRGEVPCPDKLFSDGLDSDCTIVLLKQSTVPDKGRILMGVSDSSNLMENIVAIRSTGTYGKSTEQVSRALEAYAMPNCGGRKTRVADICMNSTVVGNGSNVSKDTWGEAVSFCESGGQRLCTVAELKIASDNNTLDIGGNDEWAADILSGGGLAFVDNGMSVGLGVDVNNKAYRCCENR